MASRRKGGLEASGRAIIYLKIWRDYSTFFSLWWSQQDSNLRPLACEANSNRNFGLNLSKTPNNFKAYQSACFAVSSRSLRKYTDRRRYSDRVRLLRRPTNEGLSRLHQMQKSRSKHLKVKPYFSPVRVLSESFEGLVSS